MSKKPKSKTPRAKSEVLIAEGIKFCAFRIWLLVFCFLLFALCFLLTALPLQAMVTGACSNCHTMHNSQDGKPVAYDFDGTSFTKTFTSTPKRNLLICSCLGCHSAIGGDTWQDPLTKAPIVFNNALPNYGNQGLAGGNFYWVTVNDNKGHNIISADNNHPYMDVAPGALLFTKCGGNTSCHANLYEVVSGTGTFLDGKQGCEKCHLNPKHHANDHGYMEGGLVTTAAQGWYRFLSGHDAGEILNQGVAGYEDDNWEKDFQSNSDHNEYLGNQSFGGFGFSMLGNTTTAYCTGCHQNFHANQGTASPWLRHPSDAVLPNSGEYSDYIGPDKYNPLVPVARPWPSLPSSPSSAVSVGDMVMCLSCHRAHASPYYKMMRWDYKNSNLSTALEGCNVCHTKKN